MRVERADIEAKERLARERSASDGRLSAALAESFNLALRRYRPQTSSGAEESRGRPADPSASSRSTERREERVRRANSPEADAPNPNSNPDPERCARSLLASLMRSTDPGAAVPLSGKSGAETRKFRRSGEVEGPRCIEVVDPRTGLRFVLSREGEVWLLSIQSQTPPNRAGLDSLLATLRGQFADRGLGPIDIVIA